MKYLWLNLSSFSISVLIFFNIFVLVNFSFKENNWFLASNTSLRTCSIASWEFYKATVIFFKDFIEIVKLINNKFGKNSMHDYVSRSLQQKLYSQHKYQEDYWRHHLQSFNNSSFKWNINLKLHKSLDMIARMQLSCIESEQFSS